VNECDDTAASSCSQAPQEDVVSLDENQFIKDSFFVNRLFLIFEEIELRSKNENCDSSGQQERNCEKSIEEVDHCVE